MQELQKQILDKIKMEQEISPFLFIGKNRELLSSQIENLAFSILKELNIPKNYLFTLKDNQDKIKISEIKNFLANTKLKSSYKIQIFFIENITSLTLEASNSCLKIFEEP
jgi:DNA polymerase III delta prime subunit